MHEFLDEAIKSGSCILIEVSQMTHNLLIMMYQKGTNYQLVLQLDQLGYLMKKLQVLSYYLTNKITMTEG